MTYCTKCGKPTDNGMICEDCIINDSPWLLAMKRKEDDLIEQIEQLKAENAALRERLENAFPCKVGETVYCIENDDYHYTIESTKVTERNIYLLSSRIKGNPRDAFLSREAAEVCLAELKGE